METKEENFWFYCLWNLLNTPLSVKFLICKMKVAFDCLQDLSAPISKSDGEGGWSRYNQAEEERKAQASRVQLLLSQDWCPSCPWAPWGGVSLLLLRIQQWTDKQSVRSPDLTHTGARYWTGECIRESWRISISTMRTISCNSFLCHPEGGKTIFRGFLLWNFGLPWANTRDWAA